LGKNRGPCSRPRKESRAPARTTPRFLACDDQPLIGAVTKNGERNFWQPIGAAWAHGDGEGFNLKLEYLPLNDAESRSVQCHAVASVSLDHEHGKRTLNPARAKLSANDHGGN
jgi:hypothetical protein